MQSSVVLLCLAWKMYWTYTKSNTPPPSLPEILHWDWSPVWFPWSCSPSLHVSWELLCFLRKIWMNKQSETRRAAQRKEQLDKFLFFIFPQEERRSNSCLTSSSTSGRCNNHWHVVKYSLFHYFTTLSLSVYLVGINKGYRAQNKMFCW